MKFGELVDSNDNKLSIFKAGFSDENIELMFLEEMSTLYTVDAYQVLDDYLHDLIDDEAISPFMINRNVAGVVTAPYLASIVDTIRIRFEYKWKRLWRDYFNPSNTNWINTYNPSENYDRHESSEDSTEGLEANNESTRSRYAFNSPSAVPTEKQSAKNKQSSTHESHIHGNIGVTTVYQMLEGDRNLWMWDFLNVVIEDLQKLMTIGVYDCEVKI